MAKISYQDFLSLLNDPDTPIEVLRSYIKASEYSRGGFNPSVIPDPEKVDVVGYESAMSIGNSWSRRRRRQRFERRRRWGATEPVIVSEGDSWFQFPILIDDVIDALDQDYLVWSLGAAGDTAQNIIFDDGEYLDALREKKNEVRAFLLSAAGNDIIGEDANGDPVLPTLLHPFSSDKSVEQLINKAALGRAIDRLEDGYRHLIASVRSEPGFAELPIIIHGYDYAIPHPVGRTDPRRPLWAKQDQWLGSSFASKGIEDSKLRFEIIRSLIDRLYAMLGSVAEDDPHVHVVDIRNTLTKVTDWADEIHGTSAGFKRVAAKFKTVLSEVVPARVEARFEGAVDPGAAGETGGLVDVSLKELAVEQLPTDTVDSEVTGVRDPNRFAAGFLSETKFEALIGADDSMPFWFLTEGAVRGRAVGKIIVPHGLAHNGQTGAWDGTGFLVAPNVLLTNSHVINSKTVAAAATVMFDYADQPNSRAANTVTYTLDPGRLYLSSPPNDLDYCFVWVNGTAHEVVGTIPFWRGSFIGANEGRANIIHHPRGNPKRVSLRENTVLTGVGGRNVFIHYVSDTEPGSSGSPVMTDDWKLFALHHASRRIHNLPARIRDRVDMDQEVVNEGIKTSSIAIDVEIQSRTGENAASAREVLRHLRGIDSRTGFFGALGRRVSASQGYERVVDSYRGAPQDVDVAFWNIEWFNRDINDKLANVARIISDINLDIWALQEVSPQATERLVDYLNREYGQSFDFAVSEPGASNGRQTTTVIWNSLTVRGERIDWPPEAHAILKLDSRDPDAAQYEAVEGKLFNRFPGLFRFEALNRNGAPFDFNLVPLHLKARAEGAKRRRMATNALVDAVSIAIAAHPEERDWIIGGDMNAELATGQFDGLTDAGYRALSAADEADGAFTYLKNPHKSLIDSIFVSPRMSPSIGADDFMIVAADRVYADFVEAASDHRPVMVRLSLSDTTVPADGVRRPPHTTRNTSALRTLYERYRQAVLERPDAVAKALTDIVN